MPVHDDVVHISVRGGKLAGTLISPAPRVPGVLLVHGWGGSQAQYRERAHEVAALGCVCLTFDMSGHVATQARREEVTRADNLADILAAYDFLVAHPYVDPGCIAVVGSSYGGYLAAILTGLRDVRWLALRAPALYKDEDWDLPKHLLRRKQDLARFRSRVVPVEGNRALHACAAFAGDVLLVESERDTIVPRPVIVSYRSAFVHTHSLTYRVIKDADHALSDARARTAYTSILVHWLEEMMLGARGRVRAKTSSVRGSQREASNLVEKEA
ncbi:alpha/beta hydrolase family protein [Frateuria defendens]|uniref:alpha/beta hydrolase family protein n=1 Tax=Frateuria defendens TaxID=2219559 RepID=UPI00066FCE4B|nr:alpha/beta fold hydrolase [Frateuria defendens]